MEVLILLALVAIVVVLLPKLPPMGQNVLFTLVAVPALFCLYCMIVTPSWQPRQRIAAGAWVRWGGFALAATGVIAGVVIFWLT